MSDNKTEQPTETRLRKAREEGRVAKSIELNAFVVLIFLMMFWAFSLSMWNGIESIVSIVYERISMSGEKLDVKALSEIVSYFFEGFLPVLVMFMVFALIPNVVQVGKVFSIKAISPDFSRVNPISGFKKIYTKKIFYDFFRILMKISLIYILYASWFMSDIRSYFYIELFSYYSYVGVMSDIVLVLFSYVLIVLGFSSMLDYLYVKYDYRKGLMMTKQEVKDEVKNREGDSDIKSKRKKYMKEFMDNVGVLNKVSKSDAVIVNPIHLAVLISYDAKSMTAPKVIGKGSGALVFIIKKIARRNSVLVVENKKLARMIYYKTALNGYIPMEAYPQVANIYRDMK